MRVTKENVDVLKPGMSIKVNGKRARLIKKGNTRFKIYYQMEEGKGSGKCFADLEHFNLKVEV